MTTKGLRKLLFAANTIGVLAVLSTAVAAVRSGAGDMPVYSEVSTRSAVNDNRTEAAPPDIVTYESCWTPDIKKPDPVASSTVGSRNDPIPLSGQFKLYSTFFVSDNGDRKGYAAISFNNEESIYAKNDRIADYTLSGVFPEKVILTKGGQEFVLERDPSAAIASAEPEPRPVPNAVNPRARFNPRPGRTKATRPAIDGDRSFEPIEEPDPDEQTPDNSGSSELTRQTKKIAVSSRDKQYVTENFAKILHDVNLQTELSPDDGSMTGVKIDRIKTDSILYKVGGIRAGDIIKKVDGKSISSVAAAMSMYEQYTKDDVKNITVEIERNGRSITNSYSIEDLKR